MIEGGTPNTLLRNGLDRKSLPAGTEIVVDGYRAKSGLNRANGRDIMLADGRKLTRFVEKSLGNIHRPMSDKQLEEKFRDQSLAVKT